MNSLEFIECSFTKIIPPSPCQDSPPSYMIDNLFNPEIMTQNVYKNNSNLIPLAPGFDSIIQQKIGLMNQAGLQEIKEVSTIHEKSCSTSKILHSNFQSRVMNNSFTNGSLSNNFVFINKRPN